MKHTVRRILTSKYFIIPVAALLLYSLMGFVIVPRVIRWYVPKYARESLQCQAVLDRVRINPFLLTIEAKGFSLSEPDGSPLAAFERLFVDLEMSSLFHWAAVFRELRLDKPVLHITFESDGRINVEKLASNSTKPKEPEAPSSKSFPMVIQSVAIKGGRLAVTDKRPSKPAEFNLESLDFNLKDLSTLKDHEGTVFLTATTDEGETIRWEGQMTLAPLGSRGKLNLGGVKTATVWEFVRDSFNLDPPTGQFNVITDYNLDASHTPLQMTLEGFQVGLSDLSLKLVGADKALLELEKVELTASHFDLASKVLQVERLLVEGGAVDVRVDQSGLINLQRITRQVSRIQKKAEDGPPSEPGGAASEVASRSDPAFKVKADAIEIKSIAVTLDDASRPAAVRAVISSVDLNFKADIEAGSKEIKGSLKEISSELKEVGVVHSQSPEPQFSTEKVIVEGGECDLGAHSFKASRIALSNGNLDVTRDREGRIDWMELFGTKGVNQEDSGSEPAPDPAALWNFLVTTFDVEGFRSKLSDLTRVPDKAVSNLQGFNARVSDIDGKSPMGFRLGFQVVEGGSANITGKIDPSVPSVEAEVDIAGLVLTPVQPYLEPFITLVLRSATISAKGSMRYGIDGADAKLVYDGGLNLSEVSLTGADPGEPYVSFDAMEIPRLKLTLEPNGLEVGDVTLKKPAGELIIEEDRTVNLAKILKNPDGDEKTPVPSKSESNKSEEAFPFRVGQVRVENGYLVFADLSLRPKFMTRIYELKGAVNGISSAQDALAKIQLDGRVDQYGLAKIDGVLRLYDFKRSADIDMVFRNVEMTNLSPYSGRFAGRRIKSGKLSADLKYQLRDYKMEGDNKIIVDNFELGERVESPDAVNLPLDLAIALLKDSNGRINIGLPVTGDLNNPEFSIGPLIWKAFVSLVTKAATAPFRALGSLFGGESAEFDVVEFDPGNSELLPPEKEKLKKLSEALHKRPQLKLVVQGRYSADADGMEFKDRSVRRAVATRLGAKLSPMEDPGQLDFTDPKVRRILEDMYKERFGKSSLEELETGIKQGTVKPRMPAKQQEEKAKHRKAGLFSKMMNNLKLYKIIPGGKSPEEAAAWAGELYVRLVESEPVSDEAFLQLAGNRARAIVEELEGSGGVPEDRLSIKDPEPSSEDVGPSAKLSLGAL